MVDCGEKGGDIVLLGEYEHTLDIKGRLAMPAKLRDSLGNKFIITKGLDGCLFVYDFEQWKILEAKLEALPMGQKKTRDYARFFFGSASEGECDKQGRVLLPANLRKHAALEKEAVIVGVGNRVEIWDSERWRELTANSAEDINNLSEQLADLGF